MMPMCHLHRSIVQRYCGGACRGRCRQRHRGQGFGVVRCRPVRIGLPRLAMSPGAEHVAESWPGTMPRMDSIVEIHVPLQEAPDTPATPTRSSSTTWPASRSRPTDPTRHRPSMPRCTRCGTQQRGWCGESLRSGPWGERSGSARFLRIGLAKLLRKHQEEQER